MIVLLSLLLILILIDYSRNKKIFTPGIVFNAIFFVTLLFYVMYLSDIQNVLSERTILCLWISVVFYNVIVFSMYGMKHRFNEEPFFKCDNMYFYGISENTKNYLRIIIIALFVLEVIYCKGFPLLWKFDGSGKTYFDFGIPTLNGFMCGLIMMYGAYTLFLNGFDKYFCLSLSIFMVSRQMLITIVLEGLLFKLMKLEKPVQHLILKMFFIVIIGMAIFGFIGNMRTGEEEFLRVAQFKKEYDFIPTSFKWIYSYMCFSISNFNELVAQTNGFENFGASMFNSFMPTVLSNLLHIKENASYYYLISPNFNVSTCYPEIYLDFGLLGIAMHSVIIGIFSCWSFYKYKKTGDRKFALIYAVFLHNICMFFFNNMFIYLPVISQIVLIPLFFSKQKVVENRRII